MSLRLLAIYFWYSLVQGWLNYQHSNLFSPELSLKGLLVILGVVVFSPVAEEYLVRYWIYGKQKMLRSGLFFGFLFFVGIVTGRLSGLLSPEIFKDWSVVSSFGLGLIVCAIFWGMRITNTRLVNTFERLKYSWVVFIAMCVLFFLYHLPRLSWFDLDFIITYWMGALSLTYVAKRYGMALAIFIHMIHNALIITKNIEMLNSFGDIERDYFYFLFPACVVLLGVYHYWIYRLRKNPEYTPRLWFPN